MSEQPSTSVPAFSVPAHSVAVDAVEDFGGPEPGRPAVHARADAGAGTEAAPTGALDESVARRTVDHPADAPQA